jgi:hypothetical protein
MMVKTKGNTESRRVSYSSLQILVLSSGVVINYIRIAYWYCYVVTKMAHPFRGELDGEPRSKREDGLSKRARILST